MINYRGDLSVFKCGGCNTKQLQVFEGKLLSLEDLRALKRKENPDLYTCLACKTTRCYNAD